MVNATLNDAATVTMSANYDTIHGDCVENELRILARQSVETLLNYVISVEILNHGHDLSSESIDDDLFLFVLVFPLKLKSAK